MFKEGSIYKNTVIRGKKKYKYYCYQYIDEFGEKHTKSFPHTKLGKKAAIEYQHDIMEKREKGFYLATQDKTVGDWVSEYLLLYKKPKLRETSYRRQLVSAVKLTPIANIPLDKLMPTDVQQLYNDLSNEGLSNSSISNVHKLLSESFKRAFANKLILSNPMLAVDPIIVKSSDINILTYRQIRLIFGSIRKLKKGVPSATKKDTFGKHFNTSHDYELLFWMLLTTGMRIAELLALDWSDIDFENRIIRISKSKANTNGNTINAPKTARGKREIPILSDALLHRLKAYQEQGSVKVSGPVFATRTGKMLSYQNIYKVWAHIMSVTGINQPKGRAFHVFRHTFASYILRNYADIIPLVSLSRILGHNSTETTLRIYQHHIPSDNEKILCDFADLRKNKKTQKAN